MSPTPPATRAVRDAVRAALTGAPTPVSATSVSDDDLVAEATAQRVVEVLVGTGLSAGVDERLCAIADAQRMAVLQQVRQMTDLADALTGLPWLSFKGPLLAIQTTGDFASRGHGDLDVLVSRDDVGEAYQRIRDAGWSPYGAFPQPGPSWAWRHLLRTYCEVPLVGVRSAVDLHWALASTLGTLPTFARAWDRREEVELAGRSWPTLCRSHAFRHTCIHAATDYWGSLRSLVDVHRLASEEAMWAHLDRDLVLTELATLRVVQDRIGLPPAVPAPVLAAVAAVPRRRLVLAEWGVTMIGTHDPGNWTSQSLLTRLRMSTSAAEAAGAVGSAILPAYSLAGLHSEHAVVAVPQALGQRVRRVTRRVRQRLARRRGR